MKRAAVIFFLALGGPVACKKAQHPAFTVLLVNASLNESRVDVYGNSSRIFSDLSYPDSTGYLPIDPTPLDLTFFPTGSVNPYLYGTGPYPFQTGQSYSFFLLDSAGGAVQGTLVRDDLTSPAQGSAKVRFFNFAYTAPGVDLVEAANGEILFTDVGFDVTGEQFVTVPSGAYGFNVRATGAVTLLTSVSGVNLLSGGIYTLFLRGIDGGIGTQALQVGVIRNK